MEVNLFHRTAPTFLTAHHMFDPNDYEDLMKITTMILLMTIMLHLDLNDWKKMKNNNRCFLVKHIVD